MGGALPRQGVGFLALFMPTRPLMEGAAPATHHWNTWVEEWMRLWQSLPHCEYWNACWQGLFSRLSKHDVAGIVSWGNLLPALMTQILWGFEIPVGSALGSSPVGRRAPRECHLLFAGECLPRMRSSAKILVYSLTLAEGGSQQHLNTLT
eukprot:gene34130-biopygen15266